MKYVSPIAFTCILTGCAPGYLVGPLPVVSDIGQSSTVIFVRPLRPTGVSVTVTITIDGVETVELGTGEHVTIPIAAGEHLVGVKGVVEITLGRIHKTRTIQAEPGRRYHFRIDHAMLDRVPETEGIELVAKTTALMPQPK